MMGRNALNNSKAVGEELLRPHSKTMCSHGLLAS